MIALDTSALLRYLTNDDPGLAAKVALVLDGPDPVSLSVVVLLEAAYALRTPPYLLDNPGIADTLIRLLAHESVYLSDMPAGLASAAITGIRHMSARHIADALIAAAAQLAGARLLVTNDRKFAAQLVPVRQLAD